MNITIPAPTIPKTVGIIQIELALKPATSNAVVSIGIKVAPTTSSTTSLKALSELNPATKTLPHESVAMPTAASSGFPAPSPVASMISVMVPPGVIFKALLENCPATKTLPDESVAIPLERLSVFPPPSPVLSMISVMVPPGVILKAWIEPCPVTKTLPDESVATPNG